jgi:hypothetical protein
MTKIMKQRHISKTLLSYLLLQVLGVTKLSHALQAPVLYSSLFNKLGSSSSSSDIISKSTSTPIRKVAIIGSGICGLSLAHALENSQSCAKPYLDALSSSSSRKSEVSSSPSPFGIETFIFDSRSSLNFETGAGEIRKHF